MNKSSFFKVSLVIATVLVAVGATVPQKSFARETGTVPIIKSHADGALLIKKDNTTTPIIVEPDQTDATAPSGDTPDDLYFTVTITVNAPTTVDTPVSLDTNHPEAISLPGTAIVSAGNSTVTLTVPITAGNYAHHKHVKIYATSNGTTIEGSIRIHYHGEND